MSKLESVHPRAHHEGGRPEILHQPAQIGSLLLKPAAKRWHLVQLNGQPLIERRVTHGAGSVSPELRGE